MSTPGIAKQHVTIRMAAALVLRRRSDAILVVLETLTVHMHNSRKIDLSKHKLSNWSNYNK